MAKQPTTQKLTFAPSAKQKGDTRVYILSREQINKMNQSKDIAAQIEEGILQLPAEFTYNGQQIILVNKHHLIDREKALKILEDALGITISQAEFERLVEDLTGIEQARKDLTNDPAKTLSEFYGKCRAGVAFTYHREYGDSGQQWFLLENDRLFWKDSEKSKNSLARSVSMLQIERFRPGKNSKLFQSKKCKKLNDDLCFSIICEQKTLDLSAASGAIRDEWLTFLEFMHRHYVPARRRTVFLENSGAALDDAVEDID